MMDEQILMVKEAAKRPVVTDDENPELTDEQPASLRRVHESRRADRRRQNVTLWLTPQAIRKAKALGKRYSGILSRIVENIPDDPSAVSKFKRGGSTSYLFVRMELLTSLQEILQGRSGQNRTACPPSGKSLNWAGMSAQH